LELTIGFHIVLIVLSEKIKQKPHAEARVSAMARRFAISIVLAAMTWTTTLMSQIRMEPQVPVPAHIEAPEGSVTIPMQDIGGRPVVDLMISGKGPYRFILDTGAVTTVVSEDLSRDLSLSAPEGMQVASAIGGPPPGRSS